MIKFLMLMLFSVSANALCLNGAIVGCDNNPMGSLAPTLIAYQVIGQGVYLCTYYDARTQQRLQYTFQGSCPQVLR